MKHLFGLQKIPEGRLKYDPRFRRHAIVFTKSFDYIVNNIAYKEKLEQHFQVSVIDQSIPFNIMVPYSHFFFIFEKVKEYFMRIFKLPINSNEILEMSMNYCK